MVNHWLSVCMKAAEIQIIRKTKQFSDSEFLKEVRFRKSNAVNPKVIAPIMIV